MSDQILVPLSPKIESAKAGNRISKELADDIEILKDDHSSLQQLVESILANKRLAYFIVSAWCNQNNYYLVDKSRYP